MATTAVLANHELIRMICGEVKHLPGEAVEFGVFHGDSLAVICDELAPVLVWGLDSFLGLPQPGPHDGAARGLFSNTSEARVRVTLGARSNYRIVPGWFADTLPTLSVGQLKFAHLDCDHYASYRQALEWLWPRLVAGGKVIADDYGASLCRGARLAMDEWIRDTSDCEACPPQRSTRMVIIKTEARNGN